MDIAKITSTLVKETRGLTNLSQADFAKVLGLTGQYIYYLERGTKVPSTELYIRIQELNKELKRKK